MARLPARLALFGVLALACGDDGNDDTAAGTTVVPPSTGSDTTAAAATTEAAEGESTGTPAECDAVMCGEGELCVVPTCCDEPCTPDPPFCAAANTVLCDFGTAICTLEDVCSGPLQGGALVCEPCDG